MRQFIADLPPDETVVFQDEVAVHLNPTIGSCWMRRGQQAEVVTPGNNEKRHVAGSLHWRTGRLLLSAPGTRRNAELFVAHLDDLRCRLRSFRVIHVVCDNARFHDCRAVRKYLQRHGARTQLHFLPKYAPETDPIERVWWHLHEDITATTAADRSTSCFSRFTIGPLPVRSTSKPPAFANYTPSPPSATQRGRSHLDGSIDLQPVITTQAPDRDDILNVGGFIDAVFGAWRLS